MPDFSIYSEHSLGFSHYGEVTAEGEGVVTLTDSEVQQLVDLIKENGGETDVEALDLENKYPEIYETLDEAYREAAFQAVYYHWVVAGYENGWYEVDLDDAIEKCESNYGFHFDFDEEKYREENGLDPDDEIDEDELYDEKSEAFDKWVEQYRATLDREAEVSFLCDVFELDPDVDTPDYEVMIPDGVIELAEKE